MNRLFNTLFLISVLISCAGVSAAPPQARENHEFSLPIGQSVTLKGTKFAVRFKAVLEDSRCPINTFCVMAGNGQVELEIFQHGSQNQTVTLNTDEKPNSTTLDNQNLKLISLNPSRIEGKEIAPGDYSVTLRVERLASDH